MTVALFVVALACLSLIIWATPGVVHQHRVDIAVRNLASQLRQVVPLFERFAESAAHVSELVTEFVSAWAKEVVDTASALSSLPVDSSYPQESPGGGTYSGRDGKLRGDPVPPHSADNPPGTSSLRDPNTRGSNSTGRSAPVGSPG